ncbi:scavenger receptor class F member 1-like [Mercenaria mercenaria]|uniref:scavenger receptor class F member 1-like n=1 Tax=Mercenaria mercenaria TaxID=6596 RepID=UPI00234F67ED|nr:scavenger receptor class F member 1-like [Mercenaria mercenaria]
MGEGCQYCSKTYGSCSACIIGYWGSFCEKECPTICAGQCNRYTGKCSSCRPGHKGVNCSSTCIEENCETCQGLDDSHSCTKCRPGYWGESCDIKCRSEQCLECHMSEGRCTLCEDGFWGNSCNQKCHDSCQCCSLTCGTCSPPHSCIMYKATAPSQTDNTLVIVGIVLIVCSLVVPSLAFGLICYIKRRNKQKTARTTSGDRNVGHQSVSYSMDRKRKAKVEIPSLQTGKVNRKYLTEETNKGFEEEENYESVLETDEIYENP